jgi:1-acyl-sn-glycerol-3-phosphate acyltransferase
MESTGQPPADLLPVRREATPVFRFLRLTVTPLLHLLFVIKVSGRQNIPRDRNYVLIANHLGWLDSFLILAEFPAEPRVHFLGATEQLVKRKVQWAIVKSVAGYIPVNRKVSPDTVLYEHVNRCLQRGGVIALYPEGNYGPAEGEIMPFRKGFAHFAIDNDVPVLPVALSGTRDIWLRKAVRVIIGQPIETRGLTVESLVPLAETRLGEILPPYREPAGPKLLRARLTHLF